MVQISILTDALYFFGYKLFFGGNGHREMEKCVGVSVSLISLR